jgi:hypothetical protein
VEGLAIWDVQANAVHPASSFFSAAPYPREVTSLASGPDGYLYVAGTGFYPFKVNFDTGDVATVLTDGAAYSIKFINGTLQAAGYQSSGQYPPCYWVGTTRTNLPWSSAGGVQRTVSFDIAAGPDGAIYNCGVDIYSSSPSYAPKLWKGTALQTVPAWNGTSSGGAWAIAVK